MDRISTATKAVDLFGAGKHGFKNGNLALAIAPTDLNAEWCNVVQEELVRIAEAAGVALNAGVYTQVLQAIRRLSGGNLTTLTALAGGSVFNLTPDNAGVVFINAAAGNATVNLPATTAVNGVGLEFKFYRLDATANTVVVNRAGADTIDGATSFSLSAQYSYRAIEGDATSVWATVAQSFTSSLPAGTPLMWALPTPPAWALVRDGSAISRTAYAALFAALCPTRSMTTANGTKNLTGISDTKDLYVGMPLEGAGIPAGATVESITGLTTATMTLNATASNTVAVRIFYFGYGSGGSAATFGVPDDRGLFERGLDAGARTYEQTTLSGSMANGANTITGLASTKGLFIGMSVPARAGLVATTITQILSSTSVQVANNASAAITTQPFVFVGGQIANERSDELRSHTHDVYADRTTTSVGSYVRSGQAFDATQTTSIAPAGGAETRPRFRNYLPIIAY